MRMTKHKFKIGQLVKQSGINYWKNPAQVLRVAKRSTERYYYGTTSSRYFVVGAKASYGYGVWVGQGKIVALSPLELLAMQI